MIRSFATFSLFCCMLSKSTAGCSSAPAVPAATVGQQEAAAGAGYKIDSALCIDKAKYPRLAESNACIATVDAKWHRLSDGGPDPVWFAADGGAR